MVVALKPLHDKWIIKRIVVSTYQSVTGAGQKGVNQLEDEISNAALRNEKFPHPIAYNCLPHIDIFFEHGYTREEIKMVNETKKIMRDDSIARILKQPKGAVCKVQSKTTNKLGFGVKAGNDRAVFSKG